MPTRQEHINNYYKYYSLARIPDKKKYSKTKNSTSYTKYPKETKNKKLFISKAHLNLLLPPKLSTSAIVSIYLRIRAFGIAW